VWIGDGRTKDKKVEYSIFQKGDVEYQLGDRVCVLPPSHKSFIIVRISTLWEEVINNLPRKFFRGVLCNSHQPDVESAQEVSYLLDYIQSKCEQLIRPSAYDLSSNQSVDTLQISPPNETKATINLPHSSPNSLNLSVQRSHSNRDDNRGSQQTSTSSDVKEQQAMTPSKSSSAHQRKRQKTSPYNKRNQHKQTNDEEDSEDEDKLYV
jgi:hypothetical protein